MSASLFLMRHGEAGPGQPDSWRELTARGRKEAVRMAHWLASRLEAPEREALRIAASPYVRAQQTAAIVAEHLNAGVETLALITPDEPIDPVIDWLQGNSRQAPWLLVSHMPLVGALAARLVDGDPRSSLPMPTAGVAALEAEVWAAGCAQLKAFSHPAEQAG